MPPTLTPYFSDNFTRADENPLAVPPWELNFGSQAASVLEIVSDLCQAPLSQGLEFYLGNGFEPNTDVYASATIANIAFSGVGGLLLQVRADRVTDGFFGDGYFLAVYNYGEEPTGPDSRVQTYVYSYNHSTGFSLLGFTDGGELNVGDVFTLVAVGTTIFVLQNGIIRMEMTDTAYAVGLTSLGAENSGDPTQAQVSNFEMGSAAVSTYSISGNAGAAGVTVGCLGLGFRSVVTDSDGNYTIPNLPDDWSYFLTPSLAGYTFSPTLQAVSVSGADVANVNFTAVPTPDPSSLPFLGSVTVVDGVPSGMNDVFLGTLNVLDSPPDGQRVPYLGKVRVVGSAPAGPRNVLLGSVVVVDSKPANIVKDVWLGSVVEG